MKEAIGSFASISAAFAPVDPIHLGNPGRYDGSRYTLVAVNTSDSEQTVPFWFPIAGDYVEELHGGVLDLRNVPAWQEIALNVPSYYGRIWTSAAP